jgi:hypothetical protein
MIGSVRDYLNWVTTDDNGYLTQEAATRWRQFVEQSIEGRNTQRTVIGALGLHLPEPIPDALHEDPELDLGGYWLGLQKDPIKEVKKARQPTREYRSGAMVWTDVGTRRSGLLTWLIDISNQGKSSTPTGSHGNQFYPGI